MRSSPLAHPLARHASRASLSLAASMILGLASPARAGFSTTTYAASSGVAAVAVAQLNADTDLDMVVVNRGTANVGIYFGAAGATFGAAAVFSISGFQPSAIAVADFDGDLDNDLAVTSETGDVVSIMINSGGGSFTLIGGTPVGDLPVAIASGLLNNDTFQDLAIASRGENKVSILIGVGNGTFTPAALSPAVGGNPGSIAIGDLNADLLNDLAVTNFADGTVSVLTGNGDGSFDPAVNYATGGPGDGPSAVAIGLLNAGTVPDLVVTNGLSNRVAVLLGTGGGLFGAASLFVTGINPSAIVIGDFDGNGTQDLATANADDNDVTVLRGSGSGTFSNRADYPVQGGPRSLATGDFNFDGDLDMAAANFTSSSVSTLVNDGLTPTPTPTASPTRSPTVSPTRSPTASPTSSPTPSPTPDPLPEDDCAKARCLGDRVPYTTNTAGATGTDVVSCGAGDDRDVWYSYTPSLSGVVTIDTLGSLFNTTLALFSECGGVQLACNDDAPGGGTNTSYMSPDLTAGTTYLIRVAGVSGSTGSLTITVTGGVGGCILTSPNEEVGGRFGVSTQGGADMTGDSTPDLLVGAYLEDPGPFPGDSGMAYLFSGSTLELLREYRSSDPIYGGVFGRNVRGAGDVTNDGLVDVILSAPGETVGAFVNAGRIHILNGGSGALVRTYVSPNAEANGQFGTRGNGMNDVTGDGEPDLLATAPFEDPGASPTDAGRAYIFNGQTGALFRTFASPNAEAGGNFGANSISLKDVTGDGKGDLIVGAPGEDPGALPTDAGKLYLLDGATGAVVWQQSSPLPVASSQFGRVVSRLDDVTGDAKLDVAVGELGADGSGLVHMFNGATGAYLRTVASPNPQANGGFGQSIANILDANGDGWGDLVIGAPDETNGPGLLGAGRAYVVSGRTGALLHTLQSPQPETLAQFGFSVGSVPDLDGNGYIEYLIGARKADPGASPQDAGRAYLFYGRLLP